MFSEIETTGFEAVRHLFAGHKQYIPVLAVIEERFPGRVFVDNAENPSVAIVWALGCWAYIEGDQQSRELWQSLRYLLSQTIIPDSKRAGLDWFELYVPNSNAWLELVDGSFEVFDSGRHFESVYTWDDAAYRKFRSQYQVPDGVALRVEELPLLPEELLNSPFIPGRFHKATAIGGKAVMDTQVVAVCRSNGLATNDEFMVDIVTFKKEQRGKGYATAAAVALFDHCLENSLIPVWETTEFNTASHRLALKLGFVEQESYPVYRVVFQAAVSEG